MIDSLKPTIYDQENPGAYIPRAPDEKIEAVAPKADPTSLRATIYDQDSSSNYIPKAPLAREVSSAVGADVIALPVEYDETNLPLFDQYRIDYNHLTSKQKRGLLAAAAALTAAGAIFVTGPGTTLPQVFHDRAVQIVHLFGG